MLLLCTGRRPAASGSLHPRSCTVLTLLVLPAGHAMWRRDYVRIAMDASLRTDLPVASRGCV
jgi:hypothetical protein